MSSREQSALGTAAFKTTLTESSKTSDIPKYHWDLRKDTDKGSTVASV